MTASGPESSVTQFISGNDPNQVTRFDWPVANQAEKFLRSRIENFLKGNRFARSLAERMRQDTGTDFFEWTDHLVLTPDDEPSLIQSGFVKDTHAETPKGQFVYEHPLATFPRVLIGSAVLANPSTLVLRAESVDDFMSCHGLQGKPQGEAFSRYRYLTVAIENNTELAIVERCGYRGFVPLSLKAGERDHIIKARELWRTRPRVFRDAAEGFQAGNELLEQVLELIGPDQACQFFFEAEREYWQKRNQAAKFQKHRQDQLGLGWANHDHHTFRCSRQHFVDLISFLIRLGFQKRERYYAGTEAGWGAQICEQPVAGVVVFADVDLLPEETQVDFSTMRLSPGPRLGTVGLWVGLHGESFLEAGMHHLEARFDFVLMDQQLRDSGINTMRPFSNFDFLRQAFTEGERWRVNPERVAQLVSAGLISRQEADRFIREGALGSHLENLQRHGGFKGFNQKSVSAVIQATDPRKSQPKQEIAAA